MRSFYALALALPIIAAGSDYFLVEPYIQLGNNPRLSAQESLTLMWHSPIAVDGWTVEVKSGGAWKKMAQPVSRRVSVVSIPTHVVWSASLTGLAPGGDVEYRVLKDDAPVFSATTRARKSEKQAHRFVATGDCAANTDGQRAIASRIVDTKPDFAIVSGDIVYSRGRIAEYRQKYYPIYNSDTTPLLRSILLIGVPGNHDLANRDLATNPDTLAYFYYWSQPLNGLDHKAFATLTGADASKQAFREAAGEKFPRMANFSFDYGNAHWLVLDSNRYADWTDQELRKWVESDLAANRNATWKFVSFHHPGFNSSIAHWNDQWMRLLSPVFENNGVDVVFSGHVHNYQRSMPLRFEANSNSKHGGVVEGKWQLDRAYDGKSKTKANGVIYLVSGACGAGLYNKEQQGDPATWYEFTSTFVSTVHSITVAEVDGKKVNFRQVSANGDTVDSFTLTK
jgi:hypothetical protein